MTKMYGYLQCVACEWLLCFVLFAVSSFQLAYAQTFPGYVDIVNQSTTFDRRLLRARQEALRYISNFRVNPRSKYNSNAWMHDILDAAYSALQDGRLEKPLSSTKPKGCEAPLSQDGDLVVVLFYNPLKNVIVACDGAMSLGDDALVQNLIHESFHAAIRALSKDGKLPTDRLQSLDVKSQEFVETEALAVEFEYAVVRNNNLKDCVFYRSGYERYEAILFRLNNDIKIWPLTCPVFPDHELV